MRRSLGKFYKSLMNSKFMKITKQGVFWGLVGLLFTFNASFYGTRAKDLFEQRRGVVEEARQARLNGENKYANQLEKFAKEIRVREAGELSRSAMVGHVVDLAQYTMDYLYELDN